MEVTQVLSVGLGFGVGPNPNTVTQYVQQQNSGVHMTIHDSWRYTGICQ